MDIAMHQLIKESSLKLSLMFRANYLDCDRSEVIRAQNSPEAMLYYKAMSELFFCMNGLYQSQSDPVWDLTSEIRETAIEIFQRYRPSMNLPIHMSAKIIAALFEKNFVPDQHFFRNQLAHLKDGQTIFSTYIVPHRLLELNSFLSRIGFECDRFSTQDILEVLRLPKFSEPEELGHSGRYVLTHALMYLTDFGRNRHHLINRDQYDEAGLIATLRKAALHSLKEGHYDLFGECLMSLAYLDQKPDELFEEWWKIVLHQVSFGVISSSPNGIPSGKVPFSYNFVSGFMEWYFERAYHTTLVGLLLHSHLHRNQKMKSFHVPLQLRKSPRTTNREQSLRHLTQVMIHLAEGRGYMYEVPDLTQLDRRGLVQAARNIMVQGTYPERLAEIRNQDDFDVCETLSLCLLSDDKEAIPVIARLFMQTDQAIADSEVKQPLGYLESLLCVALDTFIHRSRFASQHDDEFLLYIRERIRAPLFDEVRRSSHLGRAMIDVIEFVTGCPVHVPVNRVLSELSVVAEFQNSAAMFCRSEFQGVRHAIS